MNWIDQDDGQVDSACPEASHLVVALEAYQEARRIGQSVDRHAFLTEHAPVADRLAQCLDALDVIQSVAGMFPNCDIDANPSPLKSGDVLGEFRILSEVGRGGMGVVYEAQSLRPPERRVALKVLPAATSLSPSALRRFRVESQAAACLNHPNIVPVLAAGCERGIPFYSMPLIKGRSLADILRARRTDRSEQTTASRARV
jgi:serine/threonine protein kinase